MTTSKTYTLSDGNLNIELIKCTDFELTVHLSHDDHDMNGTYTIEVDGMIEDEKTLNYIVTRELSTPESVENIEWTTDEL